MRESAANVQFSRGTHLEMFSFSIRLSATPNSAGISLIARQPQPPELLSMLL